MITESTMPCAPPVSARRVGPEPSAGYRDQLHTVGRVAGTGFIARGAQKMRQASPLVRVERSWITMASGVPELANGRTTRERRGRSSLRGTRCLP